jgi:hypothetical protein
LFSALENTTEKMPKIVHVASMTVPKWFSIGDQKMQTSIYELVSNSQNQFKHSFSGIEIEMSVSEDNVAITITHASDGNKPTECLKFIDNVIQKRFTAFEKKIKNSTCTASA